VAEPRQSSSCRFEKQLSLVLWVFEGMRGDSRGEFGVDGDGVLDHGQFAQVGEWRSCKKLEIGER
jgi:hypothetical protein